MRLRRAPPLKEVPTQRWLIRSSAKQQPCQRRDQRRIAAQRQLFERVPLHFFHSFLCWRIQKQTSSPVAVQSSQHRLQTAQFTAHLRTSLPVPAFDGHVINATRNLAFLGNLVSILRIAPCVSDVGCAIS